MDFVPLIDSIGEPSTIALLGFGLAFAFGFAAQYSGFCTRSALLETIRGIHGGALVVWLTAFATTLFFVQLAIYGDLLAVAETRFFSTPQSLSGALVGGGLFGIGMALARGCASRMLVLGASGNLRAIVAVLAIGGTAWLTLRGFLAPVRDTIAGIVSSTSIGSNDLAAQLGLGTLLGPLSGAILLILSATLIAKQKPPLLKTLAGLFIGLIIAGGWVLTYTLSTQVFEPIQAESLSFIRPSANIIDFVNNGGAEEYLSLDTGIIFGVVFGALISSLVFRTFKVQTFSEKGAPHFLRYLAGGALMGFGGVLAVGCTIGAGFTGVSVLAINSIVGLSAMLAFGAGTEYFLARAKQSKSSIYAVAAE